MVAPSEEGVIKPLVQSEHSVMYDEELEGRYDDNMRIDIPFSYSQKMGFGHDKCFVKLYNVDGDVWMSTNDLNFPDEYIVPTFWNKHNGNPRSDNLHDMFDDIFLMVPKDVLPFGVGDKVSFRFVKEVPNGHERHLVMSHAKD